MSYGRGGFGKSEFGTAQWVDGSGPWKLNLGCGRDHRAGYVNIDSEALAKPDVVADLEQPWLLPDKSVSHIIARHMVEHLRELKVFFVEAYRVMRPDALFEITVPHHCSEFFWGDPTHIRPITRLTLDLFSKKACEMFAEKGYSNTPLAVYWDIDFEIDKMEYGLNDRWKDKFDNIEDVIEAMDTFNNVASEIKFVLRRMKEPNHG